MKLILLLIALVFLAGCTEQAMFSNDSHYDTPIGQNYTQNMTQEKSVLTPSVNNTIENRTIDKPKDIEVSIPEKPPVIIEPPKEEPSSIDYSGNPLDLFKNDALIIFGDSGSLVAATINMQAYIGAVQYKQDDKGELPAKNVILLGNCTNSYISKLTSCDTLQEGVHLRLLKKDKYVLIIFAKNPADIFDAVNVMIKPDFKMREEI
jgi:hypothetical protein